MNTIATGYLKKISLLLLTLGLCCFSPVLAGKKKEDAKKQKNEISSLTSQFNRLSLIIKKERIKKNSEESLIEAEISSLRSELDTAYDFLAKFLTPTQNR